MERSAGQLAQQLRSVRLKGCSRKIRHFAETDGPVEKSPAEMTTYVKNAARFFGADLLACFIRGLGYQAIPCGNDTALSVPLAMAAGLGESSRMGLLITPKFGSRVRICKLFTDLPLESDDYRPFWVHQFCQTCKNLRSIAHRMPFLKRR
jgi:hypothetical protein